ICWTQESHEAASDTPVTHLLWAHVEPVCGIVHTSSNWQSVALEQGWVRPLLMKPPGTPVLPLWKLPMMVMGGVTPVGGCSLNDWHVGSQGSFTQPVGDDRLRGTAPGGSSVLPLAGTLRFVSSR